MELKDLNYSLELIETEDLTMPDWEKNSFIEGLNKAITEEESTSHLALSSSNLTHRF